MNKSLFPRFTVLMKGLCRELKKEGKGDTIHHEALDEASLGNFFFCLCIINKLTDSLIKTNDFPMDQAKKN